jgi:hypothetical protein
MIFQMEQIVGSESSAYTEMGQIGEIAYDAIPVGFKQGRIVGGQFSRACPGRSPRAFLNLRMPHQFDRATCRCPSGFAVYAGSRESILNFTSLRPASMAVKKNLFLADLF